MRGLSAESVHIALTDPAHINRGERLSCLSVLHQGPLPCGAPWWRPNKLEREIR